MREVGMWGWEGDRDTLVLGGLCGCGRLCAHVGGRSWSMCGCGGATWGTYWVGTLPLCVCTLALVGLLTCCWGSGVPFGDT